MMVDRKLKVPVPEVYYGGFELKKDDKDADKKWGGKVNADTTGAFVKDLQDDLVNLGFLDKDKPRGFYGPLTESATKQFQETAQKGKRKQGDKEIETKEVFKGKVSGVCDQDTAKEIAKWKKEGWTRFIDQKPIIWGKKVSAEFRKKVVEICSELSLDPDYLMACMAFESGESFSPSIKNAAGSGAVGLIQFMPSTAKGMGTTTDKLSALTAEAQLDYVKKYFTPYAGKLKTLSDVYMAILLPSAVGKPEDHVLFNSGTLAYTQNAGLDTDEDGKITKKEAASLVQSKYDSGKKHIA